MPTEMIMMSVAIIAIGVGVIAYVLLHGPKDAAHIGDTPEISLGDIPEGTPDADTAAEAEPAEVETADATPTAEAPAEKIEE